MLFGGYPSDESISPIGGHPPDEKEGIRVKEINEGNTSRFIAKDECTERDEIRKDRKK